MEKRLIPVNIFDTSTMEQWLSQMGDEGLILDSFSGKKAVFQGGDCKKIKYRLIPTADGTEYPSTEMKELFEEEGWQYISNLEKTFFVFSNDAEYPKAVPFSKEEEQSVYEALKKKKRNSMLLALLGFFFVVGVQLILNLYFRLDDYILGNEINQSYAYFFVGILNIFAATREYRSYAIIKRKLESMEIEKEEDSPYMPTTKWVRLETVLQILAFILMLVPLISDLYGENDPVDILANELPIYYVPLEEVENTIPDMKYFNDYTYVSKKTSLLAPVQYAVVQRGKTYDDADENVIEDEPELNLSYIELKYSELGEVTLHSLMRHFDTSKLELEGVDQAWVEKAPFSTNIFLLKDNKILEIHYWGEADILSHLKEYADILQGPFS